MMLRRCAARAGEEGPAAKPPRRRKQAASATSTEQALWPGVPKTHGGASASAAEEEVRRRLPCGIRLTLRGLVSLRRRTGDLAHPRRGITVAGQHWNRTGFAVTAGSGMRPAPAADARGWRTQARGQASPS